MSSSSSVTRKQAQVPLVLAIDIGTSSVRAGLYDRLGRAVEGVEARRPHEIHTTAGGASETDPDTLLEFVWQCLDEVLEQAGTLAADIAGVGACTFVTNVLGVDEAGHAVTPLSTYADTRSAGAVDDLRAEFDEKVVHDRTGCHFHPSYWSTRFRWLDRTQPELLEQVTRWVSIGEYLEQTLFGATAVSYSVAAWTGLLDRENLAWDQPLLAALPISEANLSPLTDVSEPRQGLRGEFAERWPALRDVPWFPAAGDGATANVGSGCVSPDRVALTVGTTSAMRAVVDGPVSRVPAGLWCYRVDGERSLPGGALTEGGSVFEWMTETLQFTDLDALEPALAALEPDAHGLTVLPFFAGERSPGWAGHARATVHGLTLATTPTDILRAGLESVAYRIGLVFEMLQAILPAEPEVVASGGAILSSPTWLQIMTDVLGRPVAESQVQEASSRGAALLALESLGALDDISDAPDFVGAVHEPDVGRHTRYREAMERQRNLYDKLVRRDA